MEKRKLETDLDLSMKEITDNSIIDDIEAYSKIIQKSIQNNKASDIDYIKACKKIEYAIEYLKKDIKNKLSISLTEKDLLLDLNKHFSILEKHIQDKTKLNENEYDDLYKSFENFGNIVPDDSDLDNTIIAMKKSKIIRAYVLYCENPELLNFMFKPLYEIKPILDIDNFKESYLLDRPALTINGKSIYLLIKNVPISLELDFKACNPLLLELQLKGMDSHTIHAKKTSQHHENIYRNNRKFGLKEYLYIIMLMIIEGLSFILAFTIYINSLNIVEG